MKITILAVVVTAMIFCEGCSEENFFFKYTSNGNGEIEVIDEKLPVTHVTCFNRSPMSFATISEFTYKGHEYIKFHDENSNFSVGGVVHSPDCEACKFKPIDKDMNKDNLTIGQEVINIKHDVIETITDFGKFKDKTTGEWKDVVIYKGTDRFTGVPMTFVREIEDFCKDFEINKRDEDE